MSRVRSSLAVLVVSLLTVVVAAPVMAQGTAAADSFVEAAGVNIHLHYDLALYKTDFELTKARLVELGVRHVRDGMIDTEWQGYYDRHNELGDLGIKGTFITSPEQSVEFWASYPAKVSRTFEAFEGPNEYDLSRDPNWAQVLNETMVRLRTLRDIPGLEQYPLYGPSLTSAAAYGRLGNMSRFYDFANLHTYFAGRHPGTAGWGRNGYGGIGWNVGMMDKYNREEKPIVTTETGYQDASVAPDPVPQDVAGRYMPRLLLEHFRAGVVRTFLYELMDYPKSGGYGLLNADGSPKPAFTAVKGLLNLLADPGPAHAPEPLAYTVSQAATDVRYVAFQKRDGTYYLALWLSAPSWDPIKRAPLTPTSRRVVVGFSTPMDVVRTHLWQEDGSVTIDDSASTTSLLPVTVSDSLTMVEIVRPTQVP